ncbi:hypothetical protein AVEN_198281-1 [Araneus ventricosus]|uniref:Uncharacterized protein n=1 Tax=Araneus ventricosus TaxID=182803 RepID=A0A4Y2PES0_ARAVE|nr:hypothetical protein AVEN_198281-1 [Araneus ventricosus]
MQGIPLCSPKAPSEVQVRKRRPSQELRFTKGGPSPDSGSQTGPLKELRFTKAGMPKFRFVREQAVTQSSVHEAGHGSKAQVAKAVAFTCRASGSQRQYF